MLKGFCNICFVLNKIQGHCVVNAKNITACEISKELCEIYGENDTSERKVWKRVREIQGWRENIHYLSHPSIVSQNLMDAFNAKIQENKRFTITLLPLNFFQVSRSIM